MWTVYVGVLKPGVKDNLNEYYDRPFEMFKSYYDTWIYRLPGEWEKKYGPGKQMDWGSWIHFCDWDGLWELMNPEKHIEQVLPANEEREEPVRLPPIKVQDLPEEELYGVLEVELY